MTSFTRKTVFVVCLMVVILQISTSYAARIGRKVADAEIKDICSRAPDPSSCQQILKSDPRTSSQNLNGLVTMAIDLAENKAKQTIRLTKSLIRGTKDIQRKARYDSCIKYFNSVVAALGEARKNSKSGDFLSVNNAAINAVDQAESCEDLFEVPPAEDSLLPQKTKAVINHLGVVFAIVQKVGA